MKYYFIFLSIIGIILIGILIYLIWPSSNGVLIINSNYFDVKYTINDKPITDYPLKDTDISKTPIEVNLPPGEYYLKAEKEDYKKFEKEFTIEKNKKTVIEAELDLIYKNTY